MERDVKPINLELSDNIKRVIKDQKYWEELFWKECNKSLLITHFNTYYEND